MKVRLIQVCAYANWPTESFEIWCYYPLNTSRRKILRKTFSLFKYVFSEVVDNKGLDKLSKANFTIGRIDSILELNLSEASELKRRVYYGWYQGKCLDLKRLQYFNPKKIIKKGYLIFIDRNKIEHHEYSLSKSKKASLEANKLLQLRRLLGDDPKRIEIDENRFRLGLPANFLFLWKENVKLRTRKSSK